MYWEARMIKYSEDADRGPNLSKVVCVGNRWWLVRTGMHVLAENLFSFRQRFGHAEPCRSDNGRAVSAMWVV